MSVGMNCLAPARSPACHCQCTCQGGGEGRQREENPKNRKSVEVKKTYFENFLQRVQQNLCTSDGNKNRYFSKGNGIIISSLLICLEFSNISK